MPLPCQAVTLHCAAKLLATPQLPCPSLFGSRVAAVLALAHVGVAARAGVEALAVLLQALAALAAAAALVALVGGHLVQGGREEGG